MKNSRFTDFILGAIAALLLVNAVQLSRPIQVEAKGEDTNDIASVLRSIYANGIKVKLVGEYGYGEPTIKIKN